MNTSRKFAMLALTVVLICAGTVASTGQEVPLKDKRVSIHRENESLGTIFRDLIEKYDVAIGLEESAFDAKKTYAEGRRDYLFETNLPFDCLTCITTSNVDPPQKTGQTVFKAMKKKFTINVENAPLAKVLDLIVFEMEYYKWEINDGVVNIYPNIGREKRFEDFLNLKIKRFENKDYRKRLKSKSIKHIRYSILFSTPEVERFLKDNNMRSFSGDVPSPNVDRVLSEELLFTDLTVKGLLNEITKTKRGGWMLRWRDAPANAAYDYIDLDI